MLKIHRSVVKAIIEHCKHELPFEACGYLASKNDVVVRHYALNNIDSAADHFTMDPKEQFAAIKEMRTRRLELTGVYHSHPNTPARPSEEDIRLAYDPDISYIILSFADKGCSIKSFLINKNGVIEEEIKIIDH